VPQLDGLALAALATVVIFGRGLGAAMPYQALDGGQIRTGIEQIIVEESSRKAQVKEGRWPSIRRMRTMLC